MKTPPTSGWRDLVANFKGHLAAASASGYMAATLLPNFMPSATAIDITLVMAAGLCGGLLPDVDAGGSISSSSIPNVAAKALSLIPIYTVVQGITKDLFLSPFIALIVWYFGWLLADKIMKHRGHTHTWLGAVSLSAMIAYFVKLVSGPDLAKYAFYTCIASYMMHLLLDDLTSGTNAIKKRSEMRRGLVFIRPMQTRDVNEGMFIVVILVFSLYGLA